MKKTTILLLVGFLFLLNTASFAGGVLESFKIDPRDQVIVTLLSMVITDLQMCQASLQQNFVDNLL